MRSSCDSPDIERHSREQTNAFNSRTKTHKGHHLKNQDDSPVELSKDELRDVNEHVAQRTPVIFEIVRRTGEEELGRPTLSLASSGVTAGISMGFSVLAETFIKAEVFRSDFADIFAKLGYSVGFVIVILAHQQLFTENTLTAIVPLIAKPSFQKLRSTIRLSSVVLLANLIGTFLFSVFFLRSQVLDSNHLQILTQLSIDAVGRTPAKLISGGVGAGFLIASLVWILANVDSGKLWLIIVFTYLIAIFDFAHVIAGSAEAALLLLSGKIPLIGYFEFLIPTLIGNVIGGSGLFAILAYGQTHAELKTTGTSN